MINLEVLNQVPLECFYQLQLTRISYSLHPLREKEGYFCRFVEGTGILNKNEVVLLGKSISCIVKYQDNSGHLKTALLTNNEDYKNISNVKQLFEKGNFIHSLIEVLKYKTLRLNNIDYGQKMNKDEYGKSAILTLLLKDNSTLKVDMSDNLKCTHIVNEASTEIEEQEMYSFLNSVEKISCLSTKTISMRGSREIILTNSFTDILREIFTFVNRTLVLDYGLSSGDVKRCIIFDKQVMEIQEGYNRSLTITTYSLNKFNYGFPDSIMFTPDTMRDINNKISEYAEISNVNIIKKRH